MASEMQVKVGARAAGGCGTVFGVLFFAVFLCAGLAGEYFFGREFLRNVQTRQWTPVECRIESSRIVERGGANGDYGFEVEYIYTVSGRSYTSRQFSLQSKSFSDYGEAQRLANRYPLGSKSLCYVNPSTPDQAILERASLWLGLLLLLPLVFVTVGAVGIVSLVRGGMARRAAGAGGTPAQPAPLSEKGGAPPRWMPAAFFGLFLAAGLGAFYAIGLRPLGQVLEARAWLETPCTVVSSQVKRHQGSKGATYSVNILYAYEVGGREYRANRYHFMGGSSSGQAGKAEVVGRYPPGSKAVCYVNPRDPTDAVLERGFTADLCWGFLPLIFVLIGAGGLVYSFRHREAGAGARDDGRGRRIGSHLSGQDPSTPPARGGEEGALPKVLKADMAPVTKLLGSIAVAAFWNGIVLVFVWQVVQGWRRHKPEWFLTLFIIPFVLIGLGMILFVIRTFLALMNPRPTLTVTPGAVALGTPLEIKWELGGRAHAVRRLRIRLEGREEAQYRRGTRTYTDKSVFASFDLANTADRLAIQAGQTRLTIPAGLMHSWTGDSNKIVWAIKVTGEIPWWPDVDEEFTLAVRPQSIPPHPTT
jgi:hypothetical protein